MGEWSHWQRELTPIACELKSPVSTWVIFPNFNWDLIGEVEETEGDAGNT